MFGHLTQPKPVEGWASPPKNLGEVIADAVYQACKQRGMGEPLVLNHEEQTLVARAVRAWEAIGAGDD